MTVVLWQWITLVPLLVGMGVALVVPGFFWVRTLVRSSLVAAAAAPAVTVGVLIAATVAWDTLGITWSRTTVIPLLVAVTVLGAGVHVAWTRRHRDFAFGAPTPGPFHAPFTEGVTPSRAHRLFVGRQNVALWSLVLLGFVLAALPMLLRADPHDPVQQWDPVYHLNGVWSILHTGHAEPFGGLSHLYGGTEVFYPTAWHAFVSLFSTTTTVIEASNVSSLALMAVWVCGAAAFTAVLTDSRLAVLAAPVLAGGMMSMPADALTMYNQWPNALGLTLVPGVAALAVLLGRRLRRHLRSRVTLAGDVAGAAVLLVALVGVAGAHPSGLFSLVVLLVVPTVAGCLTTFAWSVDRGRVLLGGLSLLSAVVVVVVPVLVLGTDKLRGMGGYPRSGISWDFALSRFLTPYPPFASRLGLGMTVVVLALLCLAGAFAFVRARRAWEGTWRDLRSASTGSGSTSGEAASAVGTVPGADGAPADADMAEDGAVDPLTVMLDPDGGADAADASSEGAQEGAASAATAFAPTARGPQVPHFPHIFTVETAGAREGGVFAPVPDASRPEESHPLGIGPRPVVWPLASFAFTAFLTLLAYAPVGDFREWLLAPWYMDARRIMGVENLAMVPVAAVGFARIVTWLRAHRARATREQVESSSQWRLATLLGVWLLALTLGAGLDVRMWAVDYVYDADHLGKPGMVTTGELEMIRRMPQTLPADALVLGDPIAGAAYSEVIGQRAAVFPQLTTANADRHAQDVLLKHFKEIHTNPEVCEVVRRLGVTHFYADEDGKYYSFLRSSRAPGLYGVDVSSGFEIVDEGGTATLYRITACE